MPLAGLGYLLIAVCFLYRPAGADILAAAMLAGGLSAIVLRWRRLLLATQNAVSVLVLVRVVQGWASLRPDDIASLLVFTGLLALGNLLARLVARALRQPPVRVLRRGGR